ncbi:putative CP2 transcription factor [Rosellinia necatrix]|uniref:Putative CP2 transcription factor n=1 Tax=Rosellinia necatrix TaxID=77044 RepID=A0A1W2TQX4_ROSNE|nr:putative CP2 transcription factor [Rosellinia necatrix]
MFRQRTSSRKPGDDLLANFRQQFPEISTAGSVSSTAAPQPPLIADNAVLGAPVPALERHHPLSGSEGYRDQDPTPRASSAEWRFTPSLLDHNPYPFNAFASQPPGYYTPTPGGTNTLYHPQAGDLHTPSLAMGMGMGLNTPLSLPTSGGPIHAGPGIMDISHFQQALGPQQFQPYSAFIQQTPHQAAYVPSSFVHHDTGYETMDHDGSPLGSEGPVGRIGSMDATFNSQSPPVMGFQSRAFGVSMAHALPSTADKFRFHCTLNAPTAMVKHADEIPVTYLNKGQAYSLSIVDTGLMGPTGPGVKYRTFIRISFEDDQQRQKPGVCWSLWKEGRGTNEAHQRGGKLQAVEHVEAGQSTDGDDKRTRVEVETSSFDGFCVTWTPGVNGAAECNITVRFNFLSTDFSHSKGVKGIPVRLCAKTTILSTTESPQPPNPISEICYCKVKLFRDHGAERKLSNDVVHIKKTIEKLKQQIAQAESGGKDFGKRKRGGTHGKSQDHQRPGKAPKHKRTWSMSSVSSTDGAGGGNTRPSFEDDLTYKLQTLQDMFTSTRLVSILYLRGEDLDDPDLHPVSLPGESADLSRVNSKEGTTWQARSTRNSEAESSLVSPSPSSLSLQSQATGAAPWRERHTSGEPRQALDQPVKIPKPNDHNNLSGWIEALGVDPSYQPPTEKSSRPIACFYIAREQSIPPGQRKIHKAVYLTERSLSHFISRVAAKWELNPKRITRSVRILSSGLEVEMDDDVIRELLEGQDMDLEVIEVNLNIPQDATEWEIMAVDVPEEDGNPANSAYRTMTGYELHFLF